MKPPEPFTYPVIVCPNCQHGIDTHKGWRDFCGVGNELGALCRCLWTPNEIAAVLLKVVESD